MAMPAFNLEFPGGVGYVWMIGWSGNWEQNITRDDDGACFYHHLDTVSPALMVVVLVLALLLMSVLVLVLVEVLLVVLMNRTEPPVAQHAPHCQYICDSPLAV